jgi:hypothetical protein
MFRTPKNNNMIVVPNENGKPKSADQSLVISGIGTPAGLAVLGCTILMLPEELVARMPVVQSGPLIPGRGERFILSELVADLIQKSFEDFEAHHFAFRLNLEQRLGLYATGQASWHMTDGSIFKEMCMLRA